MRLRMNRERAIMATPPGGRIILCARQGVFEPFTVNPR